MNIKNHKITVKNMVCNRCIKVVTEELLKNQISFLKVELGTVELKEALPENIKENLRKGLEKEGFEIVEDKDARLINRTKSLIIEIIHYDKEKPYNQNFSDFLSKELSIDYTYLSKLFSLIEGKTIEKYIIEQKIEKTKELLVYNELNLTEISFELDYSSPQHLSRQFKQITGLTPSQFKKIGKRKKIDHI